MLFEDDIQNLIKRVLQGHQELGLLVVPTMHKHHRNSGLCDIIVTRWLLFGLLIQQRRYLILIIFCLIGDYDEVNDHVVLQSFNVSLICMSE